MKSASGRLCGFLVTAVLAITTFLLILTTASSLYAAGEADAILSEAEKIQNAPANFKIDLKIKDQKTSFKAGDSVSFVFKTDKDCYLTLIDVGTSGETAIIFPNQWHESNLVKAGQEFMIPPDGANFHYQVKEPKGGELVKAIASLKPIESLAKANVVTKGPFKVLRNPRLALKDIVAETGAMDKKDWSTADLLFSID